MIKVIACRVRRPIEDGADNRSKSFNLCFGHPIASGRDCELGRAEVGLDSERLVLQEPDGETDGAIADFDSVILWVGQWGQSIEAGRQ